MTYIDKEKVNDFVKRYFMRLRIKRFLISTILFTIFIYLTRGGEKVITSILVFGVVGVIMFLTVPDLLLRETKKLIEEFYNKGFNDSGKLELICNLKKFDGPTFGILNIDKGIIEFKPFRENLQNEGFIIKVDKLKNIQIGFFEIKSSFFNRIFFKELCKSIKISFDGRKVILQTPETEKAIRMIKERIYRS